MLEKVAAVGLILLLLPIMAGRTAWESEFRRVVPDDPEIARTLRELDDVPADSWYAPSLAYLCRLGAVEAEGRFYPDAPMDRAAFGVLLDGQAFAPEGDEPENAGSLTWAECLSILCQKAGGGRDAGVWAQERGLVEGLSWVPGEEITRAEAAVVLERFCRLREDKREN